MPFENPTDNTPSSGAGSVRYDISFLTKDDLYLFNEGEHYHLYDKLGSHPVVNQ